MRNVAINSYKIPMIEVARKSYKTLKIAVAKWYFLLC